MPQTEYEVCYVLAWNGSETAPVYAATGRAALGCQTIQEWMARNGFADRVTDPEQLAEIQSRLDLPEPLGGAFMADGHVQLVFYDPA
jgi:hypothetical protein